jgi:hypothetical protein
MKGLNMLILWKKFMREGADHPAQPVAGLRGDVSGRFSLLMAGCCRDRDPMGYLSGWVRFAMCCCSWVTFLASKKAV